MTGNLPLVTVITCTYNLIKGGRDKYIAQCFSSIHNQTYKNIEHIVIDGASTDGTLAILEKYAAQGKLQYYSEPDDGIYDAMNKGILKAKGKYIAFMNSDDFYNRLDAVEQAVKVLEEQNADFCGGNTFFLDETNPANSHYRYANLHQVFTLMPFCHQTMFCLRSVMMKEGMFDTSFKSAGDYDFIIRLYLKGYKGAVVPLTYVTFRIGGESYVNYQVSHQECLCIADKYFGSCCKLSANEQHQWLYHHVLPAQLENHLEQYLQDKTAFNLPKLTVITVCFNLVKAGRIDSFKKCVDSVHNQTYPNIEHLVIDGASKDGTLDILQEYADKGLLKYISEPDKGIYDAMRKGVANASGEYCYFLNTDDYLHDDTVVADIMDFFAQNNVDACFGDLFPYVMDEVADYQNVFDKEGIISFADIYSKADILRRNIHHQTIFYNKNVFDKASFFDDETPEGSDWVLHSQAFIKNSCRFKYINRTIACFNLGGVSTNAANNPIEEYEKLQKHIQDKYGKFAEKQKKIILAGITLLTVKRVKGMKKFYLLGCIPVYRKKDYKKQLADYRGQVLHLNNILQQKDQKIKKLNEQLKELQKSSLSEVM